MTKTKLRLAEWSTYLTIPYKSLSIISLSVIFQLIFTAQVSAQWQRTLGPEGAEIVDFVENGDTLFASTRYSRAYYSIDTGNTWVETVGLTYSFTPFLTKHNGAVYAATFDGAYRFRNSCDCWVGVNSGLPTAPILRGLTEHKGQLFTTTSAAIGVVDIYRYNDTISSWVLQGTVSFTPPGSVEISTLFSDGNELFLVNRLAFPGVEEVVFKSANGVNWTGLNNGVTFPYGGQDIIRYGDRLLMSSFGGIYVRKDTDTSWTLNAVAPGTGVRIFAMLSFGSKVLVGTEYGVYSSLDSGATWNKEQWPILNDRFIKAFYTHKNTLFVSANDDGVYASTDAGLTWENRRTNLRATVVLSLNSKGSKILAGTAGSIHLADSTGTSWSNIGANLPAFGIPGNTENNGTRFIYDATARDGVGSGNFIVAASISGFYRSYDEGVNWDSFEGGDGSSFGQGRFTSIINFDAPNGGINLFAGKSTGDFGGVFSSDNLGSTWGRDSLGIRYRYSSALTSNDSIIYLGTGYDANSVFYRSLDSGKTWIANATGLPTNRNIEAMVAFDNIVLAYVRDQGLYRSTNNGLSFNFIAQSIVTYDFTFDPTTGTVYRCGESSSLGDALEFSTDSGLTWQSYLNGLNFNPDLAWSLHYESGYIFAGIEYLGVWKSRAIGNTVSIEENPEIGAQAHIVVSPNPSNGLVQVSLTGMEEPEGEVVIINMNGEQVFAKSIHNRFNNDHVSLQLNISDISDGAYFLMVRDKNGTYLNGEKIIKY